MLDDMTESKTFTISTQCLENYGAHCESGKFKDGKNYWKFKCGTTYVVNGLDRLSDAVAFITSIVTTNNIYFKEIINDFRSGCPQEVRDDVPYVELNVNDYMNADKLTRRQMMSKVNYPDWWDVGARV